MLGSQRFSQEEVIEASGLKLGSTIGNDDLDRAVKRLGDTGAFDQVTYAYTFSQEGVKVDFQLKDGGAFVPARFDNVVWLPEAELQEQLHARVPLYHGQVPLAGSLLDEIDEALAGVLSARGIQATASYVRGGGLGGPVDKVIFTVQGPVVHVHAMTFPGATGDFPVRLQTTAARLLGGDYLQSSMILFAGLDLRALYLQTGYLRAHFLEPVPHVAQSSPVETQVDVEVPVQQGLQYRVKEVAWTGNSVFPSAQLDKLLHLVPGSPANQLQLQTDLGVVLKLYGTRGYLRAQVRPEPAFDDSGATVSYSLALTEGDLYRFDQVSFVGLDAATIARLQKAWRLRPGDPYDRSYPQRFLDETAPLLPLAHWGISSHEAVDDKQKTVALTLRFAVREGPPH